MLPVWPVVGQISEIWPILGILREQVSAKSGQTQVKQNKCYKWANLQKKFAQFWLPAPDNTVYYIESTLNFWVGSSFRFLCVFMSPWWHCLVDLEWMAKSILWSRKVICSAMTSAGMLWMSVQSLPSFRGCSCVQVQEREITFLYVRFPNLHESCSKSKRNFFLSPRSKIWEILAVVEWVLGRFPPPPPPLPRRKGHSRMVRT